MKIPKNPFSEDTEDYQTPHFYFSLAIAFLFLLLLLRLWYLQIVRGEEFREMSVSNRTRVQDVVPPRGLIMDRHGTIMVDNYPSYELAIIREDVTDLSALANRVAYLLGHPLDEVQERINAAKKYPAFQAAVLYRDLSREDLVAIETHRFHLPGLVIQVKPKRAYLYGSTSAHLIGYLSEVTSQQLGQDDYSEHRMGDMAGQCGVEKEYETYLHGQRGQRILEVNASGRVLKVKSRKDPIPGDNVHLTIDVNLQKAAEKALGDQVGSVVAIVPDTGEILAMASSPTFDPSDFVTGISAEKWKALLDNPRHPLENRAISGQYPPGSTFKLISAAAFLEENIVDTQSKIFCSGVYPLGDRNFHCWNRYGHGSVNLRRSLVESCDIFYYDAGLKLGVDKLEQYCRAFGLGRKPGLGLDNERPGLVPSRSWKRKIYKAPWQHGETCNVIIGQGFNLTTPLQMAMVTAVVANGGTLYRPRIVKRITDPEDRLIKSIGPEVIHRLAFKPETFEIIRESLAGVVNDPRGTGKTAKLKDVVVCGKTGTSQVVTLEKYRGTTDEERPYEYRDHAWFVAFAPLESPQIALAVIIEHAGSGGTEAGPVARDILKAFFYPETEITPGFVISEEPLE